MKAGLEKSQLLAVGGGIAVVLVAGSLAWMGLGGLGEKQAEAEALAERMGNPALAALVNDSNGASRALRDAAEIQKLAKDLIEKDVIAMQWNQATQELAGQGQDWATDPGKWKDRLIAVQSQLQKEAKAGNLGLAPDFYLGLDGFRQKSPTAEEVPELALRLSIAERLVRRLMEARKIKEQYPTTCELLTLAGPDLVEENGTQGKASSPPGSVAKPGSFVPEIERKTFRLEIRSSPEVLYEYVKLLATDSALFILTQLRVTNEKQTFPLRSEIAKKFSNADTPSAESARMESNETKRLLEILAGEEILSSTLQIDFVSWKNPDEAKAKEVPATPATP
jgi:hypothetical protein